MFINNLKQLLAIICVLPLACAAQTDSHNYVITKTMLDEEGTHALSSVQYYDGLGHPTLSVATSTPYGDTACTLTTYDALGRECRNYAPVQGDNLEYITENGISARSDIYYGGMAFSQNHYDALDRIVAVNIAGSAWWYADKQNRTEYKVNLSSDNVLQYGVQQWSGYSYLVQPDQYYPEGTLNKVINYDADDKSVTVFTDMFGNKILERTDAGDTYYVYNNIGQLCFVLPPEFLNSNGNTIYSYKYRYDSMGRLEYKTLPQGGTTHYRYDEADHLAYTQDPILGNRYRFYLYDQFGRLCVQGTCSNLYGSIVSATTTFNGYGGICLTGYSEPSYTIADPQLEIVNYYDNYDFLGTVLTNVIPSVSSVQGWYAKGFLTGSVAYATNGEGIGLVNVYNQKGQVVNTVRKGLNGYTENVATSYSYIGDVENSEIRVDVGYGADFTANTTYTYSYGKKETMSLSVSHGLPELSRETIYGYDPIGQLNSKSRQLSGNSISSCSYYYDVHGWPTSIYSGGFCEELSYAYGLENHYYNGNISTMKWKFKSSNDFSGYNFEYDDRNRLTDSVFGYGDGLNGYRNYFNESACYDSNGNIIQLQRRGLVDNMHGGFGIVDNLSMTYNGNQLVSVRDNAPQLSYAGGTDFNGVRYQEYPLTYNEAGSLTSDAGRNIANIDYDLLNNPIRIQFTNGNVTKYIYSATGEKLRVIYQTAVPNISVAIGSTRELNPSEVLYTDSIDYLLGGALTLRNGRIDKYQFDEGYCQAEAYSSTKDSFTFCYYDKDHLGNIRQVTEDDGSRTGKVIQATEYYPFGAEFCDGHRVSTVQSHKFNGKEFDNMHGLNTYDYGARQYNPVTARWDRMDPLCEKYYSTSPYVYCLDNPVMIVDPDGEKIVGINGRPAISINSSGGVYLTKYATQDIKRIFNSLTKTPTGLKMLKQAIKSDIKVSISISSESRIQNGVFTFGETLQGNMSKEDNFGRYQRKNGKYGIKEASVVIYEGTIDNASKQKGMKHEGLTEDQILGAVVGHELVHATDLEEIHKDIAAELGGKERPKSETEKEPNRIESDIIKESLKTK